MASIRIAMLGTGLIGNFYTETLHNQRGTDRVTVVYSRSAERAESVCPKVVDPEGHNRSRSSCL